MKNSVLLILGVIALSCANSGADYVKQDLRKISWIEGNWRGTYDGKYFYEHYRFANDSTIEITTYEWNGQDSSRSSTSKVWWTDNAYFLGADKSWKVTKISDTEIYMLPANKASNDILWKVRDNDSWEAILKAPKKENKYLMERAVTF